MNTIRIMFDYVPIRGMVGELKPDYSNYSNYSFGGYGELLNLREEV